MESKPTTIQLFSIEKSDKTYATPRQLKMHKIGKDIVYHFDNESIHDIQK